MTWLRRPGGGSARGRLESAMVAALAVLSIPITVPLFVIAMGFRSAARHSATLAGLARGLGVVARWRLSYLAWSRSAALAGGRAEVHHGHDLRGVAAACLARRQFGGRLVYDSHEYFTETGGMARQQRWAKRYVARLERRFAGGGDALVTVNTILASLLNKRLRLPRAVVVRNCPPRQEPAAERPERLPTPNKLFESLAAGVPVVSSDFPERRRIVIDDPDGPLGAVCDPTDPTAIADALRSILGLEPAAAADLRARCARAARERYSWERQVPALLATYRAATGRDW